MSIGGMPFDEMHNFVCKRSRRLGSGLKGIIVGFKFAVRK